MSDNFKSLYHCSKLALFNARLLSEFQDRRSDTDVIERIVIDQAEKQAVGLDGLSLRHQGTFLGFGYMSIVLLRDAVPDEGRCAFESALKGKIVDQNLLDDVDIQGSRTQERDWIDGRELELIRAVRNGLSHGRITVDDEYTFEDKGRTDIRLRMPWRTFAMLSECVLHACTPIAYPKSG